MFSCVDWEGEEHILEYIVVAGLRLSTKRDDLKKTRFLGELSIVLIDQTEKCNERCR